MNKKLKTCSLMILVSCYLPIKSESYIRTVTNNSNDTVNLKWEGIHFGVSESHKNCKPFKNTIAVAPKETKKNVDIKIIEASMFAPLPLKKGWTEVNSKSFIKKDLKLHYCHIEEYTIIGGYQIRDSGKGLIEWGIYNPPGLRPKGPIKSFQKKKKKKGLKKYYSKGVNLTINKDGSLTFADA